MLKDPLDKKMSSQFSKEQKREYAIQKREEELKSALNDPATTKRESQKFRDHVAAERKRLGLS